jgi:CRP-like cAMP-binding protein
MEELIRHIEQTVPLSEAEKNLLAGKLRLRKVKKNRSLLNGGQVAKDVAFVVEGCLRCFSLDDNGFEKIIQFAPANWWITDMYSFITQQESYLYVDAITDSTVLLLSRQDQLAIFDQSHSMERYFRILTEKSLVSFRQRIVEQLTLSAKERYLLFCKKYPTIFNKIPQKQIALYIGVTPEFLSKIKMEASE